MPNELTLRIVLERPPASVDFGVQMGRGANYTTAGKKRSKGTDLSFEFPVAIAAAKKNIPPDFRGPVVQGPRDQRFIYIDIGTYAGQSDSRWSRRLKIPLAGITWEMIERVRADAGTVLEARVPATGRDGGPTCGTVKPFGGWKFAP
jgi:hypothetical protein